MKKLLLLLALPMLFAACAAPGNTPTAQSDNASPTLTSDPDGAHRFFLTSTRMPGAKGFYLRVHQEGDHWVADFISRRPIDRHNKQDELFFVSEDRKQWWLTVQHDQGYCGDGSFALDAPYTVCNSSFGSFSTIGAVASLMGSGPVVDGKPMSISRSDVVKAIRSIPESNVAAIYAALVAQDTQDRKNEQLYEQASREANRKASEMIARRAEEQRMGFFKNARRGTQLFCHSGEFPLRPEDDLDAQAYDCSSGVGVIGLGQLARYGFSVTSQDREPVRTIMGRIGYRVSLILTKTH